MQKPHLATHCTQPEVLEFEDHDEGGSVINFINEPATKLSSRSASNKRNLLAVRNMGYHVTEHRAVAALER